MDFTLVPICSEIKHTMGYSIMSDYQCDICLEGYISWQCINCEYSRCSKCHRNKLAENEIKVRLNYVKMKNEIKLAEMKLKMDGLDCWDVIVRDGEICYVKKTSKTYSYDYPKCNVPEMSPLEPEMSPLEPEMSPLEPYLERDLEPYLERDLEPYLEPFLEPDTKTKTKNKTKNKFDEHVRCSLNDIYQMFTKLLP